MRPRRLSAKEIAGAFPPHPRFPDYSWSEALQEFLRACPDDSVLDIDLAMGLDRFFGLPDGWWYQLMNRYYVLCELRDNSTWLDGVRAYRGGRLRTPSIDTLLVRAQKRRKSQAKARRGKLGRRPKLNK